MESINQIAYVLGVEARIKELEIGLKARNPYKINSLKWHSWNKGFNDQNELENQK